MPAVRNDELEAEKVSGCHLGRRPGPGALAKTPNLFGEQALAELGAVRFARQYWRRQKIKNSRDQDEDDVEKMSGGSGECSTQGRQVQEAGVLQEGGQRPLLGHSMSGKASRALPGSAETILGR